MHRKSCGLLNVEGFYDPLLALFDRSCEEGFIRREHRALVHGGASAAALIDILLTEPVPAANKWLDRSET